MTQFPQTPGIGFSGTRALNPNRGTTILVLGILSLVVCMPCGIVAWVMANNDLREMQAGIMDPSGQGLTTAGKICGMVSVLLWLVGIGIFMLTMCGMFATAAGVAGAAARGLS